MFRNQGSKKHGELLEVAYELEAEADPKIPFSSYQSLSSGQEPERAWRGAIADPATKPPPRSL